MSEYLDKLRSIGTPRRIGSVKRTQVVEGEGGRRVRVRTTEHWDGRVDAAVTPQPAEYRVETHRSGAKKGQVAEIVRKT